MLDPRTMRRRVLGIAVASMLAGVVHADVLYQFDVNAPPYGIEAFSFSFTAPTFVTSGSPPFTPFVVTDGTNLWTMSDDAAASVVSNDGSTFGCFAFGTSGTTLGVSGSGCGVEVLGPPDGGMWFLLNNEMPTTTGSDFFLLANGIFDYSGGQDLPFFSGALYVSSVDSLPGGSPSSPVFLAGTSVGEVTGAISGEGAEDYYEFYWGGGAFSATTSVTGASGGASYMFSEGLAGTCNSSTATLNSGDNFTGTISAANLAPGEYCVGIDANSPNDPAFTLTFNTPVSGVPEPPADVPEPSALVLLSVSLGMVGVLRLRRCGIGRVD